MTDLALAMEDVPWGTEVLPSICRLQWQLRLDGALRTPRFLGSALRGLLGHGLRKTACVTGLKHCRGCSLVDNCVYVRLFEPTAATSGAARVPYMLAVPVTGHRHLPAGAALSFEMTLLAPQQRELPYLLHAFEVGGRLGIGPEHTTFRVRDVAFQARPGEAWRSLLADDQTLTLPEPMEWTFPPAPSSVRLEWVTPWRFKRHQHFLKPKDFSPAILLEGLLYRTFELRGERPSRDWLGRARGTTLHGDARLEWQDWSRYSSRQKARMQVGGLMGQVVLEGDELGRWWPLLWAGQWLHLGKFTSMGLGRYRLQAAGLPDRT